MVRSRMLIAMMYMYLLLMVSVTLWKVVFTPIHGNDYVGMELFSLLMFILFCGSICFVVFYCAARMVIDRINGDMMFYTDLAPSAILIGKIQTGAAITMLFYFVTLPFLTLNYLLRGVDFSLLICMPIFFFIIIQQFNVISLAFVSGIKSFTQIFGNLFLLGSFFWISMIIVVSLTMILVQNTGSTTLAFLLILLVSITFAMIPTAIAFLIGKSFLSPLATNRMYPVRVAVSVFGGCTLIICIPFAGSSEGGSIIDWMLIASVCLKMLLMVGVCERDTWETRIRKKIPQDEIVRTWSFMLYSGSPNAMVWCFIWCLIITAVSFLDVLICGTIMRNPWSENNIKILFGVGSSLLLLFSYCSVALLLRNRVFYRWIPREMTWCIVLGLVCSVSMLGLLVMIFMSFGTDMYRGPLNNELFLFYCLNPLALLINAMLMFGYGATVADYFVVYMTSLVIFVASAIAIFPWIKERYSQFTPHTETVPREPT